MDKTLNPLDWEMDLLWDTKSSIVRKLNPLNWRLEMVYSADSYIQKVNPFTWDFDMVGGTISAIIKEVTGTWYVNLTNAIANQLLEFKAYGWTVQRNLPEWYTQVDYIQSNGDEYLETGIKVDDSDTVDFYWRVANTWSIFAFSQWASGDGQAYQLANATSSSTPWIVFDIENYNPYRVLTWVSAQTADMLHIRIVGKEIFIDGTSYWTSGWSLTTPTSDLRLFISSTGTPSKSFMWRFTVEWKIDLIPCKRDNDDEVWMYDLVSWTFVANAWTWAFTAWSEITPSPSAPIDITSNNGAIKAKHQSGLPLWYTLLDSVTWDGLVWINTWLTLQAGDEIDMDYEWLWTPAWQSSDRFFFGTANADTSKGWCWAELYSSNWTSVSWYARFSSLSSTNTKTDMSTQLTWHLTLKQESFTVNNVEILTPSYAWTFQDTTLTYFGRFNPTEETFTWAYLKVSEFTVKNNWVYRYYGIPCKNSSNVIWMYDLVSWTFSTKVWTWTFTAGNTVSDPIEIYTDWTVETIEDGLSNTATAEMLLSIWDDYVDEQEILTGDVTREVWTLVLDWTEDRASTSSWTGYKIYSVPMTWCWTITDWSARTGYCTHFNNYIWDTNPNYSAAPMYSYWQNATWVYLRFKVDDTNFADLTDLTNWLKAQYAAWTPVIVVYPLATTTTESVTGQTMDIQAWSNTIEITQASIDNLWLYAKYKATA